MMDCPLPAELGERSPGSREQLSGKCIFSMGVDSRAAALPALGGATAVLADVLQCHQPQIEGKGQGPPSPSPTQLGDREDVMPLPTVWMPAASGHAE